MKNKKNKGFTLAEVLITLGIIGVVAALTAPALIQHAASAKAGPALSRGISSLSAGLQSFMVDNEANTVFAADPTVSKNPVSVFQTLADKYVKMTKYTDLTTVPAILKGIGKGNEVGTGSTVFLFGDKSAIFVSSTDCNPASAALETGVTGCEFYFLPLGWMTKDVLIIGEDAFELAYDNKGNILVYGLDYGTSWTTNCTDTQVKSFTPASDKKSCGGRIAAHGFKKDY